MPTRDLPKIRTLPRLPKGPRLYKRVERASYESGPGEPPPGFINGQNSTMEWVAYWALSRIFQNPKDPRVPPFAGGPPEWIYQSPEMGPYLRSLNSAVVDFVIDYRAKRVAIRLQTERFHILTDARQQARDRLQRTLLEGRGEVIDVYDFELLGSNDFETGQKSVIAMKRAIGMIERVDPILAGTARRLRR